MTGDELCNRLMNQPWLGVNICDARKLPYGQPYYHVGTTKSAAVVKNMIPVTVLTRYAGQMMRLPVVVEQGSEIVPYASLGEAVDMPKAFLVAGIISVGVSVGLMTLITYGIARQIKKEEERQHE
jgi:hypothetical protein